MAKSEQEKYYERLNKEAARSDANQRKADKEHERAKAREADAEAERIRNEGYTPSGY